MSVVTVAVPLLSDGDGNAVADVRIDGRLAKVGLAIGELGTIELAITDEPAGTVLLDVSGADADATWYPSAQQSASDGSSVAGFVEPIVFGRIHVAVTGATPAKTGEVDLAIDR